MVSEDCTMKLVDFGFSSLVLKYADEKLKTPLGTEVYMAPEIKMRIPYKGEEVDIFSLGVMMFIMIAGYLPFHEATKYDKRYRAFIANKPHLFWEEHYKQKPKFCSDEAISLINSMLVFEPGKRIRIQDVLNHPWFNGETCTVERRREEFRRRKNMQFEKLLKKPEVKKGPVMIETNVPNGIVYKADSSKKVIPDMREVYGYSESITRLCGIISGKSPAEIMGIVVATIEKLFPNKKLIKESKTKFKGLAVFMGHFSEYKMRWMIEQLKDGRHYVVFLKRAGCKLEFLDTYRKLEEILYPQLI